MSYLLAANGCRTIRTYSGDPLLAHQVALIELVESLDTGVTVDVDGKPFDFLHRRFEVIPGKHEVRVSLSVGSRESRWPAEINAESGHVCGVVVGDRRKVSVSFMVHEFIYVFRIVDVTSGSIAREEQVRI